MVFSGVANICRRSSDVILQKTSSGAEKCRLLSKTTGSPNKNLLWWNTNHFAAPSWISSGLSLERSLVKIWIRFSPSWEANKRKRKLLSVVTLSLVHLEASPKIVVKFLLAINRRKEDTQHDHFNFLCLYSFLPHCNPTSQNLFKYDHSLWPHYFHWQI